MKRVDVASLSDRDLVVKEYQLSRELATAKFRHTLGQLEQNSEIRQLRRSRASIKSEVRRRELAAELNKDDLYRQHASALRESGDVGAASSTESGDGGGILAGLRRRLTGGSDKA